MARGGGLRVPRWRVGVPVLTSRPMRRPLTLSSNPQAGIMSPKEGPVHGADTREECKTIGRCQVFLWGQECLPRLCGRSPRHLGFVFSLTLPSASYSTDDGV